MICKVCNHSIEQERLNILPNTVFCAPCAQKHSKVEARKGIMVWNSKDCAELCTMPASYYDNNKQFFVPNGTRSVMKNFMRNTDRY